MDLRGGKRKWPAIAVMAAVPAFLLAGCGTTVIDSGKAEQLIKHSLANAPNASVKSVSCPDDVTPKAGGTFECKITVTAKSNGSEHSGTVTVHMVNDKGEVTASPSDYHLQ
jgi:hypothetical protein